MEKIESYELTPKIYLKTLSILHLALFAGPLIFGITAYFSQNETRLDFTNIDDIFLFIVPLTAITGIIIGNIRFKAILNTFKDKTLLREKLNGFQIASLIKYAFLEGPALLGIYVFFISGNLLYLLIAGVLILYLIMQRPTYDNIEQNLNFTIEQQNQFSQRDQKIN